MKNSFEATDRRDAELGCDWFEGYIEAVLRTMTDNQRLQSKESRCVGVRVMAYVYV